MAGWTHTCLLKHATRNGKIKETDHYQFFPELDVDLFRIANYNLRMGHVNMKVVFIIISKDN